MTVARPFRFIAPMPSLDLPPARWRDEIRRIEDLGFSTVAVSEHVAHGWAMDPLVVMAAAAAASQRLRVLSLVLLNDLRHPALLHRALATIDRLSDGRLEFGIGAGWQAADYEALGWPFDPASVRIERLAESLEIVTRLFVGGDVSFEGAHYQVHELRGLPQAVQQPRPPLLVGGGGRRILELAARVADIVGVHATLAGGALAADSVADFGADRIASKVDWINAALAEAGRPADARRIAVQRLSVPDRWTAARRSTRRLNVCRSSGSGPRTGCELAKRPDRQPPGVRGPARGAARAIWVQLSAPERRHRCRRAARQPSRRPLIPATQPPPRSWSAARSPLMNDSSVQAWSQSP